MKTDNPAVLITNSGAGKSPFVIGFVKELLIDEVQEIVDLVPGGRSAVITAGTNYPGWRKVVPFLCGRTLWLWEEFFQGVKKQGESSDKKMSLEEAIRMFNSLSNSGDLRACSDGTLKAPTKVSMLAGMQYMAMTEYLAGDTKGALERFTFYFSDVRTSKQTSQAMRKASRDKSAAAIRRMLAAHIRLGFPPAVMDEIRASLADEDHAAEQTDANSGEAGGGANAIRPADGGRGVGRGEAGGGEHEGAGGRGRSGRGRGAGRGSGEGRPSKRPRCSASPPEVAPDVPACGVRSYVDSRSSSVLDFVCDTFRKCVPVEIADHPFFAAVLKYDQTLYRELSGRTARREAFLKCVFGDAWEMSTTTHPVDVVYAERAARCVVATRLAVYNEIRKKASQHGVPRGGGDASMPPVIVNDAAGVSTAPQELASAVSRVLACVQAPGSPAIYRYSTLRSWDIYRGVEGWLKLLTSMHMAGLVASVEVAERGFVPVAEALTEGVFQKIRKGRGTTLGAPAFNILWLEAMAFVQRNGAAAVPQGHEEGEEQIEAVGADAADRGAVGGAGDAAAAAAVGSRDA